MTRDFSARALTSPTCLRVIAVEEVRANFDALAENLQPYDGTPAQPQLFFGAIEAHYQRILEIIGDDPALFFLDPWGVEGLSAGMIADMLAGEKHEVLVLFSEDSTHRLRGAVRATPAHRTSDLTMDLFDLSVEPSRQTSTAYREIDEAILNEVFAGLWHLVDQVAEMNPGQERGSYLESYVQIQRRLGAEYVLPMSVVDERDEHKYSLVHASKHGKAMAAMKEALHTAMNRRTSEGALHAFHVTHPGLNRLCDQIAAHFAGQEVRWQDRHARDTVRTYAVEETWALISDMPDIKAELTGRGYRVSSRPITYRFPPR